jgi:hypothetical protein
MYLGEVFKIAYTAERPIGIKVSNNSIRIIELDKENLLADDWQPVVKEKPKDEELGSWIVHIRRTIVEEVTIDHCTEDDAWNRPFDQQIYDSFEIDSLDWTVLSVKPNK